MKHTILLKLFIPTLVITACGPSGTLHKELIEGDADSLAQALPSDLFHRTKNPNKTMLTASKTAAEDMARLKADGWDPRDGYPSYEFTDPPINVSHLPGEFEPARALLIGWPSGASSLAPFFAEMIKAALGEVDSIVVYVDSEYSYSQLANALLQDGVDLDPITFLKLNIDTIWIRDYGPLVVKTDNGGSRVVDLRYYYGRWYDDVAPTRLAAAWNIPVSRPPLEAEGGNFQSDGAGNCITTEQTVIQNYHFGYTKQDIRTIFKEYLGCTNTIILPQLAGEGTGHVDMYVTITGPQEAIVGEYTTSDDATNAAVVDQGAAMLKSAGFTVRRIPMPKNWDGAYRSYTNSLAVGNRVLVPVYSDDRRYESQALSVFAKAYPGRTIVPIDSSEIIQWAGAIHCVTMTLGF